MFALIMTQAPCPKGEQNAVELGKWDLEERGRRRLQHTSQSIHGDPQHCSNHPTSQSSWPFFIIANQINGYSAKILNQYRAP